MAGKDPMRPEGLPKQFKVGRAAAWETLEAELEGLGLAPASAADLRGRLRRHQGMILRVEQWIKRGPRARAPKRREPRGERRQRTRRSGQAKQTGICPLDGLRWPHDLAARRRHGRLAVAGQGGRTRWRGWNPAERQAQLDRMNQGRWRWYAARRLGRLPEAVQERLVWTLGRGGALAWVWANRTR